MGDSPPPPMLNSVRVRHHLRYSLCPFLLITTAPLFVVLLSVIVQDYHGSPLLFWLKRSEFAAEPDSESGFAGLFGLIQHSLILNFPKMHHFQWLCSFYALQIVLYHIVPGKQALGPSTDTGFVPKYKQNGVLCYFINIFLVLFGYFYLDFAFSNFIMHLTPLIIAICISSGIITLCLLFSAIYYPQNKADVVISGNIMLDIFIGVELYPRWFGINCKQLINCRIGMTQWALICVCYILKDFEVHHSQDQHVLASLLTSPVFVSGILQILYLFKFFWWEIGYFHSLDVMHDRCGYYISWGCLAWVSTVYTMHTGILLSHRLSQTPNDKGSTLTPFASMLLLVIGAVSIFVNYAADAQKTYVRQNKGQCRIFCGTQKSKVIHAKYKTKNEKWKKSILLINGYWGISRHFHYIPELIFALVICIPIQFGANGPPFLRFFYFLFLFILLVDRTGRDDQRCRLKYKEYWQMYSDIVKYKMIPYVW